MRGRVRWWLALSAFLAVILVAVVAPAKAHANTGYGYYDKDGNWAAVSVDDYHHLDDIDSDHYVLNSGWYAVKKSFSDGDRPRVNGEVNLILTDGNEMSLRNGINVPPGSTLNIYRHDRGAGKLYVGRSEADTAAIGGNKGQSGGNINIYGGNIEVMGGSKSSNGGAGIGGGGGADGGHIRIYGGDITAKGGNEGAGIGGGSKGTAGDVEIHGGNVTAIGWWGAGIGGGQYANGGSIKIFGGNVTANGGEDAAGIGGGENSNGGTIEIRGGTVNAKGGSVTNKGGAGIGGGGNGTSGIITISGGTVSARGGVYAAGIGGGDERMGHDITISGGNVTATGDGGAAGIGGGDKAVGRNIVISGGTVSATGSTKRSIYGGAGIGGGSKHDGENIIITGGTITKAQGGADAAGIGGGDGGEGKDIKISGGTVNAHGGSEKDGGGAGIGGGQKKSCSVTITGGTVNTTGGADGAGIGGGEDGGGGTITITGGAVKATGGRYGAGIGGGEDAASSGTIHIGGTAQVTATGGEHAAGIGAGDKGGQSGSVTIDGGHVNARGGYDAAGIGTGEWTRSRLKSGQHYENTTSITIGGTANVTSMGGDHAAGIGGGDGGPSGKVEIGGDSTVVAKGGYNGGAGIGSGSACEESTITTINIRIKDRANVTAHSSPMKSSTNNVKADPGAAIGTGGYKDSGTLLNTSIDSYFIGDIWFDGGKVTAYSADITEGANVKKERQNIIGTTNADNRAWYDKGKVHFNGSVIDMYPGKGADTVKQVVKATLVKDGGIQFTDENGLYQRVSYATMNGDVNNMREARDTYRDLVLTGAEEIEDYQGTKEEKVEYKRVKIEPVHKHDLKYSLKEGDPATIVAECDSDPQFKKDCPLPDGKAEVTLGAPTLKQFRQTGEGISPEATITDPYHVMGAAKVKYYKANEAGTEKIVDQYGSGQFEQAPSVPGKYWAELTLPLVETDPMSDKPATVDTATAHVVYEIAKAEATGEATINEGSTINLADTVKDILPFEAGDWDNTKYQFNGGATEDTEHGLHLDGSKLIANEEASGPVTVYVIVMSADQQQELMQATINVKVFGKPRQVITASNVNATYGDQDVSINATVTGNRDDAACGKLSYAVVDENWEPDPADSPISVDENGKVTIKKAGSANVLVTAAATETYKQAYKLVTVTIEKKNPGTVKPTASVTAGDIVDLTQNVTVASGYEPPFGEAVTYEIDGEDHGCTLSEGKLYAGLESSGTVKVNVTFPESTNYKELTKAITVTIIKKLRQTVNAPDEVTMTYGEAGKKIEANVTNPPKGGGTISYIDYNESLEEDERVVTVSNDEASKGTLTALKAGTAYVTAVAGETENYAPTYKDVMVTVNKANPATVTPEAVVQAGNQIDLKSNVTLATGYTGGDYVEYEIAGDDMGCYMEGSVLKTDYYTSYMNGEVNVDVTIPGNENYNDMTETITVTVTTQPTQVVLADDIQTTVGATDAQIVALAVGNVEGKDPGALSYAVTDEAGSPAGNQSIEVDASGKLTIKHVPEGGLAYVTVTAAATEDYAQASETVEVQIDKMQPMPALSITGWTYGEQPNAPTVTNIEGLPETATVSFEYKPADASDYAYSMQVPTQAGSYFVRANIEETSDNYGATVTINDPFTIAKKQVNAQVTVMPKEYDGMPDATVFASVNEGLVEGDSIVVSDVTGLFTNNSVTETDANVGENKPVYLDASAVSIFGSGAENYDVVVPERSEGTINKATAYIMVDDAVVTVDWPLDMILFDAADYVPVEGEELVYELSCEAQPVAGTYPIKAVFDPDAQPNSNYNVVCFDGTLVVANAELAVGASGYAGTYDGKPHGITVTAGPAEAGAKVYYSSETPLDAENYSTEGSTTNPTFTDAGEYTVYYCVVATNYETVVGSQQVMIDKAQATVKSAPTAIAGLVANGKSQMLVSPGKVDGGTMMYSLDSISWSADVPTGIDAGPYLVLYRAEGDANHEDSEASFVLANIDENSQLSRANYQVVDGANATWTKGSTEGHPITFKRYAEDEIQDTTILHFRSVSVDGIQLNEGVQYIKDEGSVIVTLLPEYLDGLNEGRHTITATFDDGSAMTTFNVSVDERFRDVSKDAWFHDIVYTAVELGFFSGYSDDIFGPNDRITRGQAAVVIWNLVDHPAPVAGKVKTFPDVTDNEYCKAAVDWATSAGVVSGFGDGYYRPQDPVTREQFATILANYARNVAGLDTTGSETDYATMRDAIKVTKYAIPSVGWCYRSGILSGTGDGRINPQGYTSRAEAAKMIVVLYNMLRQ